jgi:hypothetical protein
LIGNALKYSSKVMRGSAHEGMYRVLNYESTLEILDVSGKRALFEKQKKIQYLQDNIIAYQDCAWGDGKILLNYKNHPGKAVDRYRSGYKTYILLALHEIKNSGDVDDFRISWGIKDGFLTPDGFWETNISQKTKQLSMNLIFPNKRFPKRVTVEESNHRKTHIITRNERIVLPDGRLKINWEKKNPRLYETYLMKWLW